MVKIRILTTCRQVIHGAALQCTALYSPLQREVDAGRGKGQGKSAPDPIRIGAIQALGCLRISFVTPTSEEYAAGDDVLALWCVILRRSDLATAGARVLKDLATLSRPEGIPPESLDLTRQCASSSRSGS